MRIAIVNDLALAVEAIKRCLSRKSDCEVAWVAADGEEAVRRCQEDRPDLILMDMVMPRMDGVEATRRIMAACPCPIIVVAAGVAGKMSKVYEAMSSGALDAVNTPGLDRESGEAFLAKVAMAQRLIVAPANAPAQFASPASRPGAAPRPPLAAIGASTGGPQILSQILCSLPADFPAALAIIQHVDEVFASGLALWLGEKSKLRVVLAKEGMAPQRGEVVVAATNDHLVMQSDMCFHYTPHPKECPYRPSVDAFFFSLERYWTRPGAALLLTGMGKDGASGLLALRRKGWHTIAQDEATSLIYSMPKAAAQLDAAEEILPAQQIAGALQTWAVQNRGGGEA